MATQHYSRRTQDVSVIYDYMDRKQRGKNFREDGGIAAELLERVLQKRLGAGALRNCRKE